MRKSLAYLLAISMLGAAAAPRFVLAEEVRLTHIHGLAYSADGKRLFVPSHHGLAVYSDGRWSKTAGPEHDYMGFAGSDNAFYSSGHPAAGSGLTNPLGVIKSVDGGRTWKNLGLEGESDFHLLAVSHATNAVYVYNPAPNSRMNKAGLYYSFNDGGEWKQAEARGLNGPPLSIAVHPSDPKVVAAGARSGLYLSAEAGQSFKGLIAGREVIAVYFDLNGRELWYSSYAGKAQLYRIGWRGAGSTEVALPPLMRDAVAYVAQNPAERQEYAIATFERSIFISNDGGKSWRQIAAKSRAS
jgi:photosystem II stability/assembly factor-like uncharacterized protein